MVTFRATVFEKAVVLDHCFSDQTIGGGSTKLNMESKDYSWCLMNRERLCLQPQLPEKYPLLQNTDSGFRAP